MKGYIKLYRKLLCNPIFKNPYLLQLFIYCLLKANHSEGKAFYGADEIIIMPGQFVTGRFELSAALGGNASSTYKRLKRLESLTMVGLQSNNKNTLVTVLNWESYQIDKKDLDNEVTADGQEKDNKVTTNGQQSNTNKNGYKTKNEKNDIYTPEFEEFYKSYPNPQDKQRTFKNWKTCLKSRTVSELMKSMENYKEYTQGRERQYIKSSANFLGKDETYKDYLMENYKGGSNGTHKQSDGEGESPYENGKLPRWAARL